MNSFLKINFKEFEKTLSCWKFFQKFFVGSLLCREFNADSNETIIFYAKMHIG